MDESQIILIDKPAGISSFGVVAKVRGYLKTKFGHKVKVGHTGTLDPFATGLLILLTGKMTKKSSEFLKLDKVYEATLKLGYTSTTGDPEGEIQQYVNGNEAPEDTLSRSLCEDGEQQERPSPVTTGARERSEKDVSLVLHSFIGKITQTPPKFSAIKINGQRAYKLARKGQDFEIPSREVKIYSIDILNYAYPELKIKVHCSSGTYIRTLAEDIGQKLGTGAYLTELRRIKIGTYDIKDALPLSHFTK
ncbi:tRNA pseudouridine(55) synthase TruB [Candidatus Saccharibacteria bacterium]|nr:tRNA pseudouridine(55) synthase TruB [Candidatus Saccharibacteria bacterium]